MPTNTGGPGLHGNEQVHVFGFHTPPWSRQLCSAFGSQPGGLHVQVMGSQFHPMLIQACACRGSQAVQALQSSKPHPCIS